ncbi:MAG: type I methionyl aminopeptidase [Phycisphaerales bacterium]
MSPVPAPVSTQRDAQAARASAQKVVEVHRRLADWLRLGVTLPQVDRFVAATLEDLHCRSCFLGYRVPKTPAFPSHACLSVNDCVVHGTAASHLRPLKPGDVLKVDIGVTFEGWIGDAAWTYLFGEPSEEVRKLAACGKESLRRGITRLGPGIPYIEWARAVQAHVEHECGFHLIRGLGGHGYGRKLHAPPYVSNTVPTYTGEWSDAYTPARPGTLVALEPMVAVGTGRTTQRKSEWPVYTADGSLSVHYEHDVLIAESGPIVLTEGMEDLADVVTR